MAKVSPPYIDKNCKSTGERIIFDMFKNDAFTKDWIVLHSLNLAQHCKRVYGEIDFLLLIPNGGIFVLEVKGGDVRCESGMWEFIDRFGNKYKNKSPINQARDAMFSLKDAIANEFGSKHRFSKIQFGYFVAFPQVIFNKHSVEYQQWQIFDKANYKSNHQLFFDNLVKNFTDKHRDQNWFNLKESLPQKKDLEEIYHFLRGDFIRVRSSKEQLGEFDLKVKSYTKEQFGVLESIQLNERSLIQGSAGTGKTMIAMESAIRTASEGKNVFLTCYNRLIGDWMQNQLKDWSNITVSSLHSYLIQLTSGFDFDKSQEGRADFFSKYLPELMIEYFRMGVASKFDKVIVDEGQDLIRTGYLSLFDSMLHGGLSEGDWEVYGDFEGQAIYAQDSKADMIKLLKNAGLHSKHLLRINCRNTREIGEETSLISGFEKPPFILEYLEGLPVSYFFYNDEIHQNQILKDQLLNIKKEGILLGDVAIISTVKYDNSCVRTFEEFPIKELRAAGDNFDKLNDIGFATIHAYKGMESNYIIITDIEDLDSETAKSLMYVGMSRARYGLILLISNKIKVQYYNILKQKFH